MSALAVLQTKSGAQWENFKRFWAAALFKKRRSDLVRNERAPGYTLQVLTACCGCGLSASIPAAGAGDYRLFSNYLFLFFATFNIARKSLGFRSN